ncbi:MAG: LSU ribosomal protein L29p (L35e), partial [uncultured Corynebacteriales bacterium]
WRQGSCRPSCVSWPTTSSSPGCGRRRRSCSTSGSRWPPDSWTTTGGCRPCAATSRRSTRSCASASSACRSPRARVWH